MTLATLPHDLVAERTALWCALLAPECLPDVIGMLEPEDMYLAPHGDVLRAMKGLHARGLAVDMTTLQSELTRAGCWNGGMRTALEAIEVGGLPEIAHVESYARVVKERAMLRHFHRVALEESARALTSTDDVETFLSEAESKILRASERGTTKQSCFSMAELARELYATTKAATESGEQRCGVMTGLHRLDALTGGFRGGEMIVIAGRPGTGKSALAGGIAMKVAHVESKAVIVFSLEMRGETWATRAISALSEIPASAIQSANLGTDAWKPFLAAVTAFDQIPIFVEDSPGLTIARARSRASRIKRDHGLAMIVVDYLQLMRTDDRHANREAIVAEISRGLKLLAMELNVPVVALAQLNRGLEHRASKRPMLADLRESGAIEQDADKIIFVYRDELYRPGQNVGLAELIVAKQRNGEQGDATVAFDGARARFTNTDRVAIRGAQEDE
jgi:replicative DNA helicase